MKRTTVNEIVAEMIKMLREAPDGTVTTTARLMMDTGYERSEYYGLDLIEVHFALMEEAEKAGITLDMSSHEGKDEGMPYSLEFVLRK